MARPGHTATLAEMTDLAQNVDRAKLLLTRDEYLEMLDLAAEQAMEREAENAWLRHAENANWAEIAWLEQYHPEAI